MKMHRFTISVAAKESITENQIVDLIKFLIDTGLADAEDTAKKGEGDLENSELALSLEINSPKPLKARCLVTVSGGVPDYVCDDDVEVQVFDFDDYNVDPAHKPRLPAHFADLAKSAGCTVEQST